METIEIRPIVSRLELERAYDIWDSVFSVGRSFFQQRLDYDSSYTMDMTWIALVDGVIGAAIQIFPYRMKYGSTELKVGGIGSVATLSEYRRRGLAQRILRRQCEYMNENGYDLSLLFTGIHSFYEQTGWIKIPRNVWNASATELKRSGFVPSCRSRVFEETDLMQVIDAYEQMNSRLNGTMIRTKAYWQGQRQWKAVEPERFLVAESSGNIAGYLRYKIREEEQLEIADCCYKPGQEEAALSLLHTVLASESQVSSVRAILPASHAFHDYFLQYGSLGIDTNEMWKSFDLFRTLTKIAPELSLRIRQSPAVVNLAFPVAILLSLGEQEAVLRVGEEQVEVVKASAAVTYNMTQHFSENEWISMFLEGFSAVEAQPSQASEYLGALFPKAPYIFWNADNF